MAYTKTTWNDGDVITADKLNKVEAGIEQAYNRHVQSLDLRTGTSGRVEGGTVKLTDGTSFEITINLQEA